MTFKQSELKFENGDKYVGEFEDNLMHGHGIYYFKDGTIFTGFSKYGKRHGYGSIVYDDKSKYEGEWNEGKQTGNGRFLYSDGREYYGQFLNGKYDGFGTLAYVDGTKFTGLFSKGQPIDGIYYFANGQIQIGKKLNNNYLEYAQFNSIYPDNSYLDFHIVDKFSTGFGIAKNGQVTLPEGHGYFTASNGLKYYGNFKNRLMHGKGKMYYSNGFTVDGVWKKNELNRGRILNHNNEKIFEGNFVNGKPMSTTEHKKSNNDSKTQVKSINKVNLDKPSNNVHLEQKTKQSTDGVHTRTRSKTIKY